jgi:hypothetical protein
MQSPAPQDRDWFISTLWNPERYPGQRAEVESLLSDPDATVRQAAGERLRLLAEDPPRCVGPF